jgi:hypothetical protein
MRIGVDGNFVDDVERFGLRFTCRDCFHFVPDAGACAHEWPNTDHLEIPRPRLPGLAFDVLFCKEFELL